MLESSGNNREATDMIMGIGDGNQFEPKCTEGFDFVKQEKDCYSSHEIDSMITLESRKYYLRYYISARNRKSCMKYLHQLHNINMYHINILVFPNFIFSSKFPLHHCSCSDIQSSHQKQ